MAEHPLMSTDQKTKNYPPAVVILKDIIQKGLQSLATEVGRDGGNFDLIFIQTSLLSIWEGPKKAGD